MKSRAWAELLPKVQQRLLPLKPIVERLFAKNLVIDVLEGDISDVSERGYPWGGPAVYVPWMRTLAMTDEIVLGSFEWYGTYRGDVHELGHAVWYLLLGTLERWVTLNSMYAKAKREGRLLDHYSGLKIEEWFAQGFEAFWTKDRDEHGINWCRDDLRRVDPDLLQYMADLARRHGADPADLM
jgi:hypothetical protein